MREVLKIMKYALIFFFSNQNFIFHPFPYSNHTFIYMMRGRRNMINKTLMRNNRKRLFLFLKIPLKIITKVVMLKPIIHRFLLIFREHNLILPLAEQLLTKPQISLNSSASTKICWKWSWKWSMSWIEPTSNSMNYLQTSPLREWVNILTITSSCLMSKLPSKSWKVAICYSTEMPFYALNLGKYPR